MNPTKNLCLCVLIGLPGSGKTTFAHAIDTSPFRKLIFSFDEFNFNERIYKDYRKGVKHRLELMINDEIDNSIPTAIIVDDIMIYESMRYEIYSLAIKYKLGYCLIYLRTDLELCILRNSQRTITEVTEDMIRKQNDKLEPPRINSQLTLRIDNNFFNTEDVRELIEYAIENPLKPPPIKNLPQIQSNVHRIDLVLRKHIGLCISREETSSAKTKLAQELNNRRRELLADIRMKELHFEEPFTDVTKYL